MPAALPADAAQAHARARQAGVPIAPWPPASSEAPGLVIDALLGLGGSRAPSGDIAAAIGLVAGFAGRGVPVLAVDVPSGLDPERGQPLGDACIVAQHTLALIGARPGLFTASGRDFAGTVWTDALGLDLDRHTPDAWLVGAGEIARGERPRRHAEHKGSFGDVAIVGGAAGMAGAALLAARAAHAAGAGRVFVDLLDAGASDARARSRAARADAASRAGGSGAATAVELSTVVCGCGGGDAVRAALPRLVGLASRLVLDADALNAVAVDTALQNGAGSARQPRPRHGADAAPARGRAAPRQRRRRRSRPIASARPSRSPSATTPPSSSRARAASSPRPEKRLASAPPATHRSRPRAPATCSPAGSAAAGARERRPSTPPRSPSSSTAPRPSRRRPARCAPRI